MLNKTTNRYAFELTDHLGNVRAVVAKNATTSAADVLSYTDYYPHGGVLPGRNFVSSPSYKMGAMGMEKDPETNFINFELRQLDPRLGRWLNPDPMGQYFSPYLAMGNNPVSIVDPTGGWSLPSDGAIDFYIDGELVSQHVYNTYTNGAGSNILSITTAGMPEGYVLGYKYNGENYYGSHGYNNAIGKMFADAKSKGLIYGEQKNSNGEVVDKGLGEYVKQEIYEEGNLNNPSINGTGEEDNLFDDKTIAYTMVLMYSDDYFNSLGVGFHSVKVDSRSIHERGLDLFVDNVKSTDRWFEGKGGQNLAKFINGFNPVFNVTNAVKIWTTGSDAYGQDASVADGFVEMASIVPVGKVFKLGKAAKTGANVLKFGGDEAVEHFGKHGKSIMDALGETAYNLKNYINDANFVIKNGTFVPEINAYVKLIGGQGSAKFAVVGLNRATGNITTFHIKTAKELSKKAPNMFGY